MSLSFCVSLFESSRSDRYCAKSVPSCSAAFCSGSRCLGGRTYEACRNCRHSCIHFSIFILEAEREGEKEQEDEDSFYPLDFFFLLFSLFLALSCSVLPRSSSVTLSLPPYPSVLSTTASPPPPLSSPISSSLLSQEGRKEGTFQKVSFPCSAAAKKDSSSKQQV